MKNLGEAVNVGISDQVIYPVKIKMCSNLPAVSTSIFECPISDSADYVNSYSKSG